MPEQISSHLRRLELRDAPFMLEWMQDEKLVRDLYTNFRHKTLDDCRQFIEDSRLSSKSLHLAIVNGKDTYMGTASLKELSPGDHIAEFGICIRACAQGTGLSAAAMRELFAYGRQALGLREIYWCVSCRNARANHFYQKNGYVTVTQPPERLRERYVQFGEGALIWYCA